MLKSHHNYVVQIFQTNSFAASVLRDRKGLVWEQRASKKPRKKQG